MSVSSKPEGKETHLLGHDVKEADDAFAAMQPLIAESIRLHDICDGVVQTAHFYAILRFRPLMASLVTLLVAVGFTVAHPGILTLIMLPFAPIAVMCFYTMAQLLRYRQLIVRLFTWDTKHDFGLPYYDRELYEHFYKSCPEKKRAKKVAEWQAALREFQSHIIVKLAFHLSVVQMEFLHEAAFPFRRRHVLDKFTSALTALRSMFATFPAVANDEARCMTVRDAIAKFLALMDSKRNIGYLVSSSAPTTPYATLRLTLKQYLFELEQEEKATLTNTASARAFEFIYQIKNKAGETAIFHENFAEIARIALGAQDAADGSV
jgi:hypothetical protein